MKKLFMIAAAALAVTAACGPSDKERTAALDATAASIDSLVATTMAPFDSCTASYAGSTVNVRVALRDSMIKVDLLGDQLMDYFASDWLKAQDPQRVSELVKRLKKYDTGVTLTVRDTYGVSRNYLFTGDKITKLLKAKPSSLDVTKVREQVVALAGAAVPAPYAHPGTQVSASVKLGFLTYTITWPSKQDLKGLKQGNLTGRYMDALRRQYGRLGDLEYPVVEMLKSLGMDGVRIVYTAADDDAMELKQAFPWREIFK